jgi:hypothetical protein
MTNNFNSNTQNKDEWLTPPHILKALGDFDLDPCAPINRPWDMAKNHYTIEDNGLMKPWEGRVWCNPPYGKETFRWLDRMADHGNGIALIFARTETIGFHRSIFDKADAIFFFQGRLSFYHVDGRKGGTANAPSCLIAYGIKNIVTIENSGLKGKLLMIGDDNDTDH